MQHQIKMAERNNNRRQNENEREQEGGWNWWRIGGAVAGVAAVAGAAYLVTRNLGEEREEPAEVAEIGSSRGGGGGGESGSGESARGVPRRNIPDKPVTNNLNSLLEDIYTRYIALNDEEFQYHYNVFTKLLFEVHQHMKDVDPYYNKYSSTVQFAGSHSDRLKIKKPDEFDVDIVIGLPLCYKVNPVDPEANDINIEPKYPGFVQLRMGEKAQKQLMGDTDQWKINKTAYTWKDERNYILRSKFTDWFKGVVTKALNKFDNPRGYPVFKVNGVEYTIGRTESGPATTLLIRNGSFELDVDLVPALKFPEDRWPIPGGYCGIPQGCKGPQGVWMVVPKPNKCGENSYDEKRSWRIAMQDQERGLMYNRNNLKKTIMLMKKLRDAQKMDKLASYYIKTLFFWEVINMQDNSYWSNNNPATIFKLMVGRLHDALIDGKIPFFWNKSCNMIGGIDRGILTHYATIVGKLRSLLNTIDNSNYTKVAEFLLTHEELVIYNTNFLRI